jgi:hypothetical protein
LDGRQGDKAFIVADHPDQHRYDRFVTDIPRTECRCLPDRRILIGDDERFVALSAVQSLWILTLHETEFHDWEASTKADRQQWMQEWTEWWSGQKETFQIPEPRRRS